MDVIIILIMGIAGSKGCIFACPPSKKKTFYERFIVQNSQVKKKKSSVRARVFGR